MISINLVSHLALTILCVMQLSTDSILLDDYNEISEVNSINRISGSTVNIRDIVNINGNLYFINIEGDINKINSDNNSSILYHAEGCFRLLPHNDMIITYGLERIVCLDPSGQIIWDTELQDINKVYSNDIYIFIIHADENNELEIIIADNMFNLVQEILLPDLNTAALLFSGNDAFILSTSAGPQRLRFSEGLYHLETWHRDFPYAGILYIYSDYGDHIYFLVNHEIIIRTDKRSEEQVELVGRENFLQNINRIMANPFEEYEINAIDVERDRIYIYVTLFQDDEYGKSINRYILIMDLGGNMLAVDNVTDKIKQDVIHMNVNPRDGSILLTTHKGIILYGETLLGLQHGNALNALPVFNDTHDLIAYAVNLEGLYLIDLEYSTRQ